MSYCCDLLRPPPTRDTTCCPVQKGLLIAGYKKIFFSPVTSKATFQSHEGEAPMQKHVPVHCSQKRSKSGQCTQVFVIHVHVLLGCSDKLRRRAATGHTSCSSHACPPPAQQHTRPDISQLSSELQSQWAHDKNAHLGSIVIKPQSNRKVQWICKSVQMGSHIHGKQQYRIAQKAEGVLSVLVTKCALIIHFPA